MGLDSARTTGLREPLRRSGLQFTGRCTHAPWLVLKRRGFSLPCPHFFGFQGSFLSFRPFVRFFSHSSPSSPFVNKTLSRDKHLHPPPFRQHSSLFSPKSEHSLASACFHTKHNNSSPFCIRGASSFLLPVLSRCVSFLQRLTSSTSFTVLDRFSLWLGAFRKISRGASIFSWVPGSLGKFEPSELIGSVCIFSSSSCFWSIARAEDTEKNKSELTRSLRTALYKEHKNTLENKYSLGEEGPKKGHSERQFMRKRVGLSGVCAFVGALIFSTFPPFGRFCHA